MIITDSYYSSNNWTSSFNALFKVIVFIIHSISNFGINNLDYSFIFNSVFTDIKKLIINKLDWFIFYILEKYLLLMHILIPRLINFYMIQKTIWNNTFFLFYRIILERISRISKFLFLNTFIVIIDSYGVLFYFLWNFLYSLTVYTSLTASWIISSPTWN